MAQFLKFKFLITLKLNFHCGQSNFFCLFQKFEKSNNKIVKFAVENFEHFGCKFWSWKLWTFMSRVNKEQSKITLYLWWAHLYKVGGW